MCSLRAEGEGEEERVGHGGRESGREGEREGKRAGRKEGGKAGNWERKRDGKGDFHLTLL